MFKVSVWNKKNHRQIARTGLELEKNVKNLAPTCGTRTSVVHPEANTLHRQRGASWLGRLADSAHSAVRAARRRHLGL